MTFNTVLFYPIRRWNTIWYASIINIFSIALYTHIHWNIFRQNSWSLSLFEIAILIKPLPHNRYLKYCSSVIYILLYQWRPEVL